MSFADPGPSVAGVERVKRIGWATIAQSASSGTNFVVGILIAREVSASDFGAFGVAIAVFAVGLGVMRGAASQPLLLRRELDHLHSDQALSFAFMGGAALGLALAVLALPAGGSIRSCVLILAASLPVLLYQDTLRFVYFNVGNPRRVAVMDTTWGIASVASLLVLTNTQSMSVEGGLAVWGGGAAISILIGLPRAAVPTLQRTRAWMPELRGDGGKLAVDGLIATSGGSLALIALGGVATVRDVASIRGARTLLGPTQLVVASAETVIIPIVARSEGAEGAWRTGRNFALVTAPALCLLGFGLGLLPNHVGRALLGASWHGTAPVLFPMGAALGAGMVWTGAEMFMRIAGRVGITVVVRVIAGIATIVATVIAGSLSGATGAAWAMFGVNLTAAASLWTLGRVAVR